MGLVLTACGIISLAVAALAVRYLPRRPEAARVVVQAIVDPAESVA